MPSVGSSCKLTVCSPHGGSSRAWPTDSGIMRVDLKSVHRIFMRGGEGEIRRLVCSLLREVQSSKDKGRQLQGTEDKR